MTLNVATKVREDMMKKRREITGARVAAWLFGGLPDCAIIIIIVIITIEYTSHNKLLCLIFAQFFEAKFIPIVT